LQTVGNAIVANTFGKGRGHFPLYQFQDRQAESKRIGNVSSETHAMKGRDALRYCMCGSSVG